MKFKEAFDVMVLGERRIRRKGWRGYWYWNAGDILIVNAEGEEFLFRDTPDLSYTLRNTFEDDWEVIDEEWELEDVDFLGQIAAAIEQEENKTNNLLFCDFGKISDDTRFEPSNRTLNCRFA